MPASVAQLDERPTGDQEVGGPSGSATFFGGDLIMKYFLWSFPLGWLGHKTSTQINKQAVYKRNGQYSTMESTQLKLKLQETKIFGLRD